MIRKKLRKMVEEYQEEKQQSYTLFMNGTRSEEKNWF